MNLESAIHNDARAEEFESAIQSRVIRIGRPPQRWFHHALILTTGTMRLAHGETEAIVSGPAVAFFPPSEGEILTVAAGSRGFLVGASPEIIGDAIGDHAESSALRVFSGTYSLAESLSAPLLRELVPLFEGIIAELSQEGRASRMVIAAYMRLLMMSAWRLRGPGTDDEPRAAAGAILQRFRQSVEVGFRRHRTIADYAGELGISPDRLHAICRRTLSRSPIELLHDRLVQEAKLRLERSARSVQDISDGLGFRDPANFSHFFKRKTGVSPAKYRSMALSAAHSSTIALSSSYHDWP